MEGMNTDSGNRIEETNPVSFKEIETFDTNGDILYREIVELRVIKTPEEVQLMRYTNRISSDAHMKVMREIRPGMPQYRAEAIFKYARPAPGQSAAVPTIFPAADRRMGLQIIDTTVTTWAAVEMSVTRASVPRGLTARRCTTGMLELRTII